MQRLLPRGSTLQSAGGQKISSNIEHGDVPSPAHRHLKQLSSVTFRLPKACCEIQFPLQPHSDWISWCPRPPWVSEAEARNSVQTVVCGQGLFCESMFCSDSFPPGKQLPARNPSHILLSYSVSHSLATKTKAWVASVLLAQARAVHCTWLGGGAVPCGGAASWMA